MLEGFTLAAADRASKLPADAIVRGFATFEETARAYDAWFDTYDVILSPVLLTPPVPIGEITGEIPFEMLLERLAGFADYTTVHNIVGAPAMSVPLHWTSDGLPVGMQFAARVGSERVLFELAYELEEARPWAGRRPPVFAG
jgi:amidase